MEEEQPQQRHAPSHRSLLYQQLDGIISPDLICKLPLKWHLIGSVVLLQGLDAGLLDALSSSSSSARIVGEAYLALPQLAKRAKSVCLETESPHGDLRVPTVRVIAGDADTSNTIHLEGGIRFCLDPTRVMFSSGNVNERMHFRNGVNACGEVVVDMFAGIGYFSVPLARSHHGAPAVIYSLELNPDSAVYLAKTVALNKVKHIVSILQGDNRDAYISQCANRVIMGYIPTPVQWIDRALSFLQSRTGGIVHYHYTAPEKEKSTLPMDHFHGAATAHGYHFKLLSTRLVKNYAPHLYHFVADIQCVPKSE